MRLPLAQSNGPISNDGWLHCNVQLPDNQTLLYRSNFSTRAAMRRFSSILSLLWYMSSNDLHFINCQKIFLHYFHIAYYNKKYLLKYFSCSNLLWRQKFTSYIHIICTTEKPRRHFEMDLLKCKSFSFRQQRNIDNSSTQICQIALWNHQCISIATD